MYSNGGFHWFMGVVEDRNDPESLGRCRVRIVGFHNPDKKTLPTKDLPWSIPLMPMTSASVSGTGDAPVGPVEGTWVLGFFLDGEEAQLPVMLGTFPGRAEPVSVLEILAKLAEAFLKTLTLPVKGLSSLALPYPSVDAVARDRERTRSRLSEAVSVVGEAISAAATATVQAVSGAAERVEAAARASVAPSVEGEVSYIGRINDPSKGWTAGQLIRVPILANSTGSSANSAALFNAGYRNGRINPALLTPLKEAPGHRLYKDAAEAFDKMAVAYKADTGKKLSITDSYRRLEVSIDLIKRKGWYSRNAPDTTEGRGQKMGLGGQPGTSNHGWGLGIDVNNCGYDSTAFKWLSQNAARFGYKNIPKESWHWEYTIIPLRQPIPRA
jgi:hypothetical protein